MDTNLYALVLAGGSGERFWPLSRRERPKQLLSLFSKATLLDGALERLHGLVPQERILLLTNHEQREAIVKLLPDFPKENIIAEPAKRDTAAAIALGVGWVAQRDPQAAMVVLPADQLIEEVELFQATIRRAVAAARQEKALVTIGITPGWACPAFGYIEEGEPIALPGEGPTVRVVRRFREKPDAATAQQFLEAGCFRWNAGMFVWQVAAITAELERNAPELGAFVGRLRGGEVLERLLEEFPRLPKISIDFAVMEKAQRVLVVEAGFDWDDVGGWAAAAGRWPQDEDGNAVKGALTSVDASDNIVYADDPKLRVALVGVSDLIVVQTGDAVLVCHRDQAEKIKQLVAKLPPELT